MGYIEELKDSVISHHLKFQRLSSREFISVRRGNLSITDVLWVTKRPVINSCGIVYNPKTMVLIWLN